MCSLPSLPALASAQEKESGEKAAYLATAFSLSQWVGSARGGYAKCPRMQITPLGCAIMGQQPHKKRRSGARFPGGRARSKLFAEQRSPQSPKKNGDCVQRWMRRGSGSPATPGNRAPPRPQKPRRTSYGPLRTVSGSYARVKPSDADRLSVPGRVASLGFPA